MLPARHIDHTRRHAHARASGLASCVTLLSLAAGCSSVLGLDEFGAQVAGEGGAPSTGSTSTDAATSTGQGTASSGGAGGSTTTASTSAGPGGGEGGAGGDGGQGGDGGDGAGGEGGGPPPIVCEPGTYTNAFGTCDILDPGTCPAGSRCSFADDDGTLGCIPENPGSRNLAEPCSTDTDCAGDLFCADGHCTSFCCPANDDPCDAIEGGFCGLNIAAPGEPDVNARACFFMQPCEPLLDECVDPEEHCTVYDFDTQEAYCIPSPQDGPEGASCMYLNDCGESAICAVNPAGGTACRHLCDLDDWMTSQVPTGGCLAGRTCTSLGFVDDWAHIGICLP